MGCNISIVDLEDCITSPSPGIPSVAILFNPKCCIESSLSVPQMSAKVCPKAQVCLRALINNQAVPSSRPNGPPLMLSSAGQPAVNSGAGMLWCFREKQPKQVGLSPSTSCDHLKGAKKTKRGQFSLTPDCVSWKHPGNKGLSFGLRYTKSAGGGSLADRGLNRQNRICKLCVCAFVVVGEVDHPGEEHLSSISYRACNKHRTETNQTAQTHCLGF